MQEPPNDPIFRKLHRPPHSSVSVFLYVPETLRAVFSPSVHAGVLKAGNTDFILAFFYRQSDMEQDIDGMKTALKKNGVLWIAYPKGGKLNSDLTRDMLREDLLRHGLKSVGLVSIDDTWSAMRFRPQSA